jgi:ParB family transcriptional regulator, chromosome partitioning protein
MARETNYYDPNALIIVGLDVDEEGHPLNDERAHLSVDENMVKNIMVYGIQQDVLIRREAGKIYVVDGRQRVKAARVAATRQGEAGEYATKVPCKEVRGDDSRVMGIMISANEVRQDDGVLVKAKKSAELLDRVGDKETTALAFGVTTKTIDNWMKLLQADPRIHEAIKEGKISATVGTKLAGKSREEQVKALDQILTEAPGTSNERKGKKTAKVGSPEGADSPKREHPGIKKGWLRKSTKTECFERLEDDQQAVVRWFLDGHAPTGHWLEQFTYNADEEMGTGE